MTPVLNSALDSWWYPGIVLLAVALAALVGLWKLGNRVSDLWAVLSFGALLLLLAPLAGLWMLGNGLDPGPVWQATVGACLPGTAVTMLLGRPRGLR